MRAIYQTAENNGTIKSEHFGTYATHETDDDDTQPLQNRAIYVSHQFGGFPVNDLYPESGPWNLYPESGPWLIEDIIWDEIHVHLGGDEWLSIYR